MTIRLEIDALLIMAIPGTAFAQVFAALPEAISVISDNRGTGLKE
ncbi:hypothetical protein [Ruminiclostridium cellobioparum]|nr:hypothetical protein [Ruminiclostridium cellobioparum]